MNSVPASAESPFYSALLAAIERGQGAPRQAAAPQWLGWLDGAQRRGEFRQSERDWLGLDDWLTAQGAAITREQLAGFVRTNQVHVQDVVLGGAPTLARLNEIARKVFGEEYDALTDDAMSDVDDQARQEGGNPKFAGYQLPGGANYRELLLTLPESIRERVQLEPLAALPEGYAVMVNHAGPEGRRFGIIPAGQSHARPLFGYHATAEAASEHAVAMMNANRELSARELERNRSQGLNFKSRHFAQLNVLVHVRFNERLADDGKRVLFLEEIQSDWHQKGRKKGYGGTVSCCEVVIDGRVDSLQVSREAAEAYIARRPEVSRGEYTIREAMIEGGLESVPDAPLKSTGEWSMVAFRRMVRWAAEHGFDRVAWTTGAQQAARYDLSKHIKFVNATKTKKGDWSLEIGMHNTPRVDTKYASNEELPDLVGKELADKIISSDGGMFTGLELKVGEEGMRGFYDDILPKAVNKWAKRFDGKVGQSWVRTSTAAQADADLDLLAKLGKEIPGATRGQDVGLYVHSIDITASMRDAALQGFPLFKRAAAQETPAGVELEEDDDRPALRF